MLGLGSMRLMVKKPDGKVEKIPKKLESEKNAQKKNCRN